MGFCKNCGYPIQALYKYCPQCSLPIEKNDATEVPLHSSNDVVHNSSSNKRPMTYNDYYNQQSTKRQSLSFRTKEKFLKLDKEVTIGIGLMNNNFQIMRGSVLPLKVTKGCSSGTIRQEAIKKRIAYDQHFNSHIDYNLLYPDGTIVNSIPGSDTKFSLIRYKEELGRPFGKIVFYLCPDKNNDTCLKKNSIDDWCLPALFKGNEDEAFNSTSTDNSEIASTSKTEKAADLAKEPTTLCPICNQRFLRSIIEVHASECGQSRDPVYYCGNSSPTIDLCEDVETEGSIDHGISTTSVLPKNGDDILKSIVEEIQKVNVSQNDDFLNINVRRGWAFKDFKVFFDKTWNKKKQNMAYRFTFIGESGVDTGGVSRDFYAEAINDIKSQYFSGDEKKGLEPCCGIVSVVDGTAQAIGHLFVASLCNGGCGPGFLSPWVYKYLLNGIDGATETVPDELKSDSLFSNLYIQVVKAKTDNEFSDTLCSDVASPALEAIGYRGDPSKAKLTNKWSLLKSLFIKERVEPSLNALNEISKGMECYNMRSALCANVALFESVFCPSELFHWDFDTISNLLKPQFSEEGSNYKTREIQTYKSFLDFLEASYYDEKAGIKLSTIMKFICGSPTKPALGLPYNLTVEFVNDCKKTANGTSCQCLPTVSTCSLTLRLPTHISSARDMESSFEKAVQWEIGFGLI